MKNLANTEPIIKEIEEGKSIKSDISDMRRALTPTVALGDYDFKEFGNDRRIAREWFEYFDSMKPKEVEKLAKQIKHFNFGKAEAISAMNEEIASHPWTKQSLEKDYPDADTDISEIHLDADEISLDKDVAVEGRKYDFNEYIYGVTVQDGKVVFEILDIKPDESLAEFIGSNNKYLYFLTHEDHLNETENCHKYTFHKSPDFEQYWGEVRENVKAKWKDYFTELDGDQVASLIELVKKVENLKEVHRVGLSSEEIDLDFSPMDDDGDGGWNVGGYCSYVSGVRIDADGKPVVESLNIQRGYKKSDNGKSEELDGDTLAEFMNGSNEYAYFVVHQYWEEGANGDQQEEVTIYRSPDFTKQMLAAETV